MQHQAVLPRQVFSAQRRARGCSSVLLASAVALCAQVSFEVCYMPMVPPRQTGTQTFGANIAKSSRSDRSHVPMHQEGTFAPEQGRKGPIKIAKETKLGALAAQILMDILKTPLAETYGQCKGIRATANAVKSVILANMEWELMAPKLSNDIAGKRVIFVREKAIGKEADNVTDMSVSGMHFRLASVGTEPPVGAGKEVLRVSMNTSVGKLAGAIVARLNTHGEAVMTTVCNTALDRVVKATTQAQRYVNLNDNSTGAQLALFPSWIKTRDGIQMRCFKL